MTLFLLIISDDNECVNNPCDVNANCENTQGSFTCSCHNGFNGDGLSCIGRFPVKHDTYTQCRYNVGPNIIPALIQRFVSAGLHLYN